jgi:predicted DNA-binding protein YlxM (UPF0122 family)
MKVTPEVALELRKTGLTYREIGERFGVSRQRVEQVMKIAGKITIPSPHKKKIPEEVKLRYLHDGSIKGADAAKAGNMCVQTLHKQLGRRQTNHIRTTNVENTAQKYSYYIEGYTLQEIANMFHTKGPAVSRQFKRLGLKTIEDPLRGKNMRREYMYDMLGLN